MTAKRIGTEAQRRMMGLVAVRTILGRIAALFARRSSPHDDSALSRLKEIDPILYQRLLEDAKTEAQVFEPVWEVYSTNTGLIGHARAANYGAAISAVLRIGGIDDGDVEAALVPVEAWNRVPQRLPALSKAST